MPWGNQLAQSLRLRGKCTTHGLSLGTASKRMWHFDPFLERATRQQGRNSPCHCFLIIVNSPHKAKEFLQCYKIGNGSQAGTDARQPTLLLTFSIEEADGQQLRLGALVGKVGMGVPDPGTVTACIWLQLHHRRDWERSSMRTLATVALPAQHPWPPQHRKPWSPTQGPTMHKTGMI